MPRSRHSLVFFGPFRYFDDVSLHVAISVLAPSSSIFSSLYATLLRIAPLLLIFFALHRRLLCSSRSVLSAMFRPRAAIICFALALYPSRFFLSLIQFILLRSDSPSAFPAIYFTLLRSNFMPLHSAPLCIARYFTVSPPLLFVRLPCIISLRFTILRANVLRLSHSLWSSSARQFSPSFLDIAASRLRIFLALTRFATLRAILPPSYFASLCLLCELEALEKSKPD